MSIYDIYDISQQEAIRLARKFFPESKRWVSEEQGIHWGEFIRALVDSGDGGYDVSHDCWTPDSDFGLSEWKGVSLVNSRALDLPYDEGISFILSRFPNPPSGRVIVIPESFSKGTTVLNDLLPFICKVGSLSKRLMEYWDDLRPFWNGVNDSIFIFESGEAFVIDHDLRLWWATSRISNS